MLAPEDLRLLLLELGLGEGAGVAELRQALELLVAPLVGELGELLVG